MCVPGTYRKMAEVGRRDFLKMAGIAALGSAAALNSPSRANAAAPAGLTVSFSALPEGDALIYSIFLRNDSEAAIADLYVAGAVPAGADFENVLETPAGAWFRGFEAEGTPHQAAIWLADVVPVGGSLGPFRYRVTPRQPGVAANAWVSWNRPAHGQATSEMVTQPTGVRPAALSFDNMADLTHDLSPAFPVFPAFQPLQQNTIFTHEEDGFYANTITMPEHCGTHMDAPVHFAAGRMSVAEIPLDRLVAPIVVIDISDRAATNPDTQVTPDDLTAWEGRHGAIPAGAAVLMYSGWEHRLSNPATFLNADENGVLHFPGFHEEAAGFLLEERSVRGIGVDTSSLDYGPSQDFATHYRWLGTNRWGLEGLANLARIPAAGALLVAAPMKLANGSGAATRVMALW